MDEYRATVIKAKDDRNGSPVLKNFSYDHAAVIVESIFDAAEQSVEILSHELALEVYDNSAVKDAALAFLRRSTLVHGTIDILVERPVPEHPFILALGEFAERVSLHVIPAPFLELYSFNFCLADDDCYRFEKNRSTNAATIQFGNARLVSQMRDSFAALKKAAITFSDGRQARQAVDALKAEDTVESDNS